MTTAALAVKTSQDDLVTLLRATITDPLSRRPVGQWVEHTREYEKGVSPNIVVKLAGAPDVPYIGTGETKSDYEISFNLHIKVIKDTGGNVDETRYGGSSLLNALTGKVCDVLDKWKTHEGNSYQSKAVDPTAVTFSPTVKTIKRIGLQAYVWNPIDNSHNSVVMVKTETTQEDLT